MATRERLAWASAVVLVGFTVWALRGTPVQGQEAAKRLPGSPNNVLSVHQLGGMTCAVAEGFQSIAISCR